MSRAYSVAHPDVAIATEKNDVVTAEAHNRSDQRILIL